MQILERDGEHIAALGEAALPPFGTAVALGFFDGVHIGHRSLLSRTVALAQERGLMPIAVSFEGLPFKTKNGALSDKDTRISRILEVGIRRIYLFDFQEIGALSPDAFIQEILLSLCRAELAVCGESFRFGKHAVGTPELLSAALPTEVVPSVTWENETVSATRIRHVLEEGKPELAARLLGAPYTLSGVVTRGKAMGRELGFPTLNIPLSEAMVTPLFGVYLSRVQIGDRDYFAVTNIGCRPTLEHSAPPNAESHVFGFSREAYGETVRVSLLRFLRGEVRFHDAAALKTQIELDKKEAEKWIPLYTQS